MHRVFFLSLFCLLTLFFHTFFPHGNGKLNGKLNFSTHFPHSAFSTLLIFYTPHFLHSAFSALRIFYTPHFLHFAFPTLPIFYTPHSALLMTEPLSFAPAMRRLYSQGCLIMICKRLRHIFYVSMVTLGR